jgi:hypothetical protein
MGGNLMKVSQIKVGRQRCAIRWCSACVKLLAGACSHCREYLYATHSQFRCTSYTNDSVLACSAVDDLPCASRLGRRA